MSSWGAGIRDWTPRTPPGTFAGSELVGVGIGLGVIGLGVGVGG
mgnify:CR=1 FL=1